MFQKIDCCPKCSRPTASHGLFRQLSEVGNNPESVVAFFSCWCGRKWASSYLLQPGEAV